MCSRNREPTVDTVLEQSALEIPLDLIMGRNIPFCFYAIRTPMRCSACIPAAIWISTIFNCSSSSIYLCLSRSNFSI